MIDAKELQLYFTKCSSERLNRIIASLEVILRERKGKAFMKKSQDLFEAKLKPTGTPANKAPPQRTLVRSPTIYDPYIKESDFKKD